MGLDELNIRLGYFTFVHFCNMTNTLYMEIEYDIIFDFITVSFNQ